eukprot:TRINITY_DN3752_c0_g2_i1.p1 TRINITY_DN3752_c0_g2~~TRINITY_DN3752_c0_g2_i1.p1  ORF type:complete len:174 (+),score=25.00 TRINITY_DN3752_c0_g2_i1:123-644(+)
MIRRPPRSTHCISSAASDVYKRQGINAEYMGLTNCTDYQFFEINGTFDIEQSVDSQQLAKQKCGRDGMTGIKDLMSQNKEQMGKSVDFEGLMSQKARIKHSVGKTAKDVLGWDYLTKGKDGICYSFYAAQSPLIGMTQPIPVPCPLGIRTFDHYEVDFSHAIEILQKLSLIHI